MKKIFSVILLLLLILTGCNVNSQNKGDGSKENPYLIYTAAEFLDFGGRHLHSKDNFKDTYFKLMNDINLNYVDFLSIGFNNVAAFEGHFDGNNHTIKNVLNTSNNYYQGLFGVIGGNGSVTNLTLENIHYTNQVDSNKVVYIGGIAGLLMPNAKIENCHVVNGKLSAKYGYNNEILYDNYVGGIVGYQQGIVKNCTSSVDIVGNNAGGIVGKSNGIDLSYCNVYDSTIYGERTAGGIVGVLDNYTDSQTNIYSLNTKNITINGKYMLGGVIGYALRICSISTSFI